MLSDTHYSVLGVDKNADLKTIKQQYYKLAKQWHPDRNPNPDAHDKFIEINTAYIILSSATPRADYDEFPYSRNTMHDHTSYRRAYEVAQQESSANANMGYDVFV